MRGLGEPNRRAQIGTWPDLLSPPAGIWEVGCQRPQVFCPLFESPLRQDGRFLSSRPSFLCLPPPPCFFPPPFFFFVARGLTYVSPFFGSRGFFFFFYAKQVLRFRLVALLQACPPLITCHFFKSLDRFLRRVGSSLFLTIVSHRVLVLQIAARRIRVISTSPVYLLFWSFSPPNDPLLRGHFESISFARGISFIPTFQLWRPSLLSTRLSQPLPLARYFSSDSDTVFHRFLFPSMEKAVSFSFSVVPFLMFPSFLICLLLRRCSFPPPGEPPSRHGISRKWRLPLHLLFFHYNVFPYPPSFPVIFVISVAVFVPPL